MNDGDGRRPMPADIRAQPTATRPAPLETAGLYAGEQARTAWPLLALLLIAPAALALQAFMQAIEWGTVLAIACWPLMRVLERRAQGLGRLRSATVVIVLLALGLLAPLALAGTEAVHQALEAMSWVRHAQASGVPEPAWITRLPFGASEAAAWWDANLARPGSAFGLLRDQDGHILLQGWIADAGRGTQLAATTFAFAIMNAFMGLCRGEQIATACGTAAYRGFGSAGPRAIARATASVRGAATSILVVGVGEGLILGAAFWAAGIPHALLLGIVAAVAAAIPFGTAAVGIVAALAALVEGHATVAIAMLCLSLLLVAAADYYVRPRLASGSSGMPLPLVLMSLLGGAAAFGLVGLFIGPAAVATALGAWADWTMPATVEADTDTKGVIVTRTPQE